MSRRAFAALTALSAGLGLWTGPALAQSFEEALAQAYTSNPSLLARRAKLRAVDEQVPQALANWRPSVKVKGDVGKVDQTSNLSTPKQQKRTSRSGTVTIEQPIFRGGRTIAATDKAENSVLAERAALVTVEQQVLLDAATAYVDTVRDLAVLELNINNEKVLKRQLEATQDQFRVGELTRTDVSQAEARLARAQADRVKADGDLKASRAAFKTVIGESPRDLKSPVPPADLPTSEEEAAKLASLQNPNVISADFTEKSAQKNVDLVRGELLPTVSLTADAGRTWRTTALNSRTETLDVIASVSVPLYEGGTATYARIREAKQTAGQRRLEIDQARRAAVETATKAWESLVSTRARLRSYASQIKASEIALEGVRRESEVGSRTVLDVLNAEQELLDARVNDVKAKRDELVAAFQLKSAVGLLTAKSLGLAVELHDPESHYKDVRGQWFGAGVDEEKGK
jgi:outer membrane protein